jgi:hypothetical protein
MKNLKIVVIRDPWGNLWSTPKGKVSWGSDGAAKSAWNCHTWIDNGPNMYNPKLRSLRQGKWAEDAVGWSLEVFGEYQLV